MDARRQRLANIKSREEVGLNHVLQNLEIMTPFARETLKVLKPFFPGEEDSLMKEFDRTEKMISFIKAYPKIVDRIQMVFMEMKDVTGTVKRSTSAVLSVVEIHEIKSLLLQLRQLRKLIVDREIDDSYVSCGCVNVVLKDKKNEAENRPAEEEPQAENSELNEEVNLPEEYYVSDVEDILDELDPRGDRLNTFYIYDEFSDTLKEYRKEKREFEIKIRQTQKKARERLRRERGVQLTPKFDIVVARSHPDMEKIRALSELEETDSDYMSITFRLKADEEVIRCMSEAEKLNQLIEEEEARVAEILSRKIGEHGDEILSNCKIVGELEFSMAKAIYSIKKKLVRPEMTTDHVIEFENARNIKVEEILRAKGKSFCPISLSLKDGVTCITGANMGGKTISLKLAGQVAIMAQYGFFVPAESAKIGLSNYMQILIGDSQSVERGLSSFGSEMEELKNILDMSTDRSLILIDEIASGTNPVEGLALTRSVIDYLMTKPYISLITTHFEATTEDDRVVNMQVRGLSGIDFDTLDREIRYAKRADRINIISKYMDYRLCKVEKSEQVPKDALNIAKMLGISNEIIDGAKKYIK